MVGSIAALISAIAALIATVWGICKYFDVKQDKKQNAQQQFMDEMRKENKEQSGKIDQLIQHQEDVDIQLDAMQDDILHVHTQLDEQQATMVKNEIEQLRLNITYFADDLRRGDKKTLNAYEMIFAQYDHYRTLGGNGFIKSEYEYIKKQKEKQQFLNDDDN